MSHIGSAAYTASALCNSAHGHLLELHWLLQFKENLEMHTRYADQPEKFMDSELDLDEEVKKLMAVAGSPELYPDFVRTNTVQTLLNLLTHQNTDIVADVIGVFEDLTDADVIEDSVSISRPSRWSWLTLEKHEHSCICVMLVLVTPSPHNTGRSR